MFLFIYAYFLVTAFTASANELPKIVTPETTYIGKISTTNNSVEEYLGIPFAKPPIKELRWQAPQRYSHLKPRYLATEYKPACYQDSYNIDWYKKVANTFGQSISMTMPQVSEDCLYLNIFKSKNTDKTEEKLPVMVWIHGGSNKSGWSYEPNYLGHNLVDKGDVIVVSIAYRLGIFGFLSHQDLAKQKAKTNFGLLDQIQALKWLQNNIEYFGGDKNNITLFGESAGAANIGYLMSSPLSKGLFHKAISQSGGFQLIADTNMQTAQKFGEQTAEQLTADSIDKLRSLPAKDIWQAGKKANPNYDFRALSDDYFLSGSAIESFKKNANVPLLIGFNKHEYFMYQDDKIKELTVPEPTITKNIADALKKEASNIEPLKAAQDWIDTFVYMYCPSIKMAKIVKTNQQNVWFYRFDRERENSSQIKAYHGGEIPYVFNSHDSWLPTKDVDIRLTIFMSNAWKNFALSGNPNQALAKGLKKSSSPYWPSLNEEEKGLFVLDENLTSIDNKDLPLCKKMWQYQSKHKLNEEKQ